MSQPIKVLIVEDSEDDAKLLLRQLRQGGYEPHSLRVETAAAMETALAGQNWDLVLSDYVLPHFSGLTALKILKEKGPDLPFIIISGNIGEETAVAAMKAGAHDYLMKNNLARLIPAIERELKEAAERRERRHAEEALRQSEKKYCILFETAVVGIFQSTPEGGFLSVNPAMARMFGYGSPQEIIDQVTDIGRQLWVHPESWEEVKKIIAQRGFLEGFEAQVYRRDGEIFWILADCRAAHGPKDEPLYIAGFMRNITELKRAEDDLLRANRALKTLNETNQTLLRATDESAFLEDLCRIVVEVGGYPLAWVGLAMQDEAQAVRPVARAGFEEGYLETLKISWADTERGRGPAGTAIRTGKTQIARDILTDPKFSPWREETLKRGHASSIALPLLVAGEAIGALIIYADVFDAFDQQEVKLLEELAMDAAFGIMTLRARAGHEKAEADIRRQSALLAGINHIFREALFCETEEELGRACLAVAEELTGSRFGFLAELNEAGLLDTIAISDPGWKACKVPGAEDLVWLQNMHVRGIYGRCLPDGRSMIANDPANHPDRIGLPAGHPPLTAFLGAPLKHAGKTIGMIGLGNKEDGYTPDDQEAVETLTVALVEALLRKRGEKNLAQLQRQHEMILQAAGEGILGLDSQGKITFVNAAAVKITGYEPEEMLGRDCHGLIHYARADGTFYPRESCPSHAVLQSGEMRYVKEEVFWTKEHKSLVVDYITTPLKENGRITGAVIIFRDITEQKRLQEQFLQAQKMEAVGRLAGGVAHDFNNLLGVILGHSEMLMMDLNAGHPLYGHSEAIKKAAVRAASLTRQLLAFSRKQILQPKVININEVVRDLEKMLPRLLGEDIEITTILHPALEAVKVDSGQMEQVIMNLAVNARDAMSLGGRLTIETANVHLDEAYSQRHPYTPPGPYVMLAVSDNGAGMDPETQARIFEPFFTTKAEGKGTGLGLSTVYGIVKQSNGYIEVYSEPGQGTTFKICFPQVREKVEQLETEAAPTTGLESSETILVVEDDEMLRKLTCEILRKQGYTVLEAQQGAEALAIGEQHGGPIHLLLTDVVMPQMGGRALVESLVALRPELKVIYMSGYPEDAIVQHGVLDPALDLIMKPFGLMDLARKVRQVLDRR